MDSCTHKIELFERYRDLSIRYSSKETLESWDKDEVLNILRKINGAFTYNANQELKHPISDRRSNFAENMDNEPLS